MYQLEDTTSNDSKIGDKDQNKYNWLKCLNGRVMPSVFLISMAGISQGHAFLNYTPTSTYSVEIGYENQAVEPTSMIILPSKYGKYFQNIENNKELVNYYRNASFFDEKDLK